MKPSGFRAVLALALAVGHRVAHLPREKLGENVSTFSSGAINTQTGRLVASLRSSLSRDYPLTGPLLSDCSTSGA